MRVYHRAYASFRVIGDALDPLSVMGLADIMLLVGLVCAVGCNADPAKVPEHVNI